jgi:putative (di)nucleoside polyphosphate hydrolase
VNAAGDDLPYRPNVGAVLFDARGLVLVARRADLPRDVADSSGWQWPQGGIDPGETPREAVLREVAEELGTDRVAILAEHDAWLTYDFPPHLRVGGARQSFRGQRQRWFALRFLGRDADIRLDGHGTPEFDAFRWIPLHAAPALAVAWKRPVYEAVAAAFAPWAAAGPAPLTGEHA